MPGDPEWLDARIMRAKQISAGLVPRLDAARPMLVKLVTAEAAPIGDLLQGTGALGQQLVAETRPGLYAISARDALAGEYLHSGKAVGQPIRARLKNHLSGWSSNQGGRLLVDLKLDRSGVWRDEPSTRRWLEEQCVARWVCLDKGEIERTEDLVLGILNHRYGSD